MSLILYNDEDFLIPIITTPPVASVSESFDIGREFTFSFNTQSKEVWQPIANFISWRNETQTNTQGTNLNGKTVGDYTCAIKNILNGEKFFAKLTMKTETQRFWKNGVWQSDARSFTIEAKKVDVK